MERSTFLTKPIDHVLTRRAGRRPPGGGPTASSDEARGAVRQRIVAITMVSIVTGCTAGSSAPAAPVPSSASQSPVSVPNMIATVVSDRTVSLGAHDVVHLSVFGNWIGFASGKLGQARANRVWVMNQTTQRSREVARTQWPHGQTDWVEGTGDWLVWTDQSRQQSDQRNDVRWAIRAQNLRTGERMVIDRSDRHGDPAVPIPRAGDGRVAWGRPASSGAGLDLFAFEFRSGQRHRVATSVVITDNPTTRGRVIYDDGTTKRDLFQVSIRTGKRTVVSDSGRALNPRASDGHVVWLEPPFGDPQAIFVADVVDPNPVKVIEGPTNGNAVVGADFLAYWDGVTIKAAPLVESAVPTPVGRNPYIPARMAAADDVLVFATQRSVGASVKIHICKIRAVL